jgi:hypothetical protein
MHKTRTVSYAYEATPVWLETQRISDATRPNVGSQRDGEIYEPLAVLTKARRVSVRSHHGFVPDCLRWVGGLGSALAVSDMRESIGQLFAAFDELHLEMALGCGLPRGIRPSGVRDTHARMGILPGAGITARLPGIVGTGWPAGSR